MLKKLIVIGSVCLLPACTVTPYDTQGYYPYSQFYVPPPVVYSSPVYIPRHLYSPRAHYYQRHHGHSYYRWLR